jgi:site-specific recombinase
MAQSLSKRVQNLDTVFEYIEKSNPQMQNEDANLRPLQILIEHFRKRARKEDPNNTLDDFIEHLRADEAKRETLKKHIQLLLKDRSFKSSLIDLGILLDVDFFYEVKRRFIYKILPFQPDSNTLKFILSNVFYLQSDALWVRKFSEEKLENFFNLMGFEPMHHGKETKPAFSELLFSIDVLSMRICGRAMEADVLRMAPEFENLESPFIALQKEIAEFIETIEKEGFQPGPDNLEYKHILVLLEQCNTFIEVAYKNTAKFGISIRVNQNLLRIQQQLERLQLLLSVVTAGDEASQKRATLQLALKLIELNCQKNNIMKLIEDSTQLIAYEITQHTGRTGERYLTNSTAEYKKMLMSSMGGGALIAFLCIGKLLLSMSETSLFGEAFRYSMLYGLGFVTIYLLHLTLATKQPAMTASTLVQALQQDRKQPEKYANFASLFARLFRSQFIAFFGNVMMVIPVVICLIFLFEFTTGMTLAEPKAARVLHELDPFKTAAVFYGAVAGVYLFISGIIAGNVSNNLKHNKIPYRIKNHPFLKTTFGRKRATWLADFYEKNAAGIASNFALGVLLGSTAPIAMFLGLSIDIRHITFSAGNFALGFYGSGFDLSTSYILTIASGVALIGMMNFMVSFSLTLLLALRSRAIPFGEISNISEAIFKNFLASPFEFFLPPREKMNQNSEKDSEIENETNQVISKKEHA